MSNTTNLEVPHGLFWVINPYQESDGIFAHLTGSKLKSTFDPDSVHPGLRHFYNLLKPKDFGPIIDVVLFWFGSDNQYCAIGVGPFGRVPNWEEEMFKFREYTGHIQVPEAWFHLVGVERG